VQRHACKTSECHDTQHSTHSGCIHHCFKCAMIVKPPSSAFSIAAKFHLKMCATSVCTDVPQACMHIIVCAKTVCVCTSTKRVCTDVQVIFEHMQV
jgi:hypothetical protein